jgi:hypothetical protein
MGRETVGIPEAPETTFVDASDFVNVPVILVKASGYLPDQKTQFGLRDAYEVGAYGLDDQGQVEYLGRFRIWWEAAIGQLRAVDESLEAGGLLPTVFVKVGKRMELGAPNPKWAKTAVAAVDAFLADAEPLPKATDEDAPF